MMGLTTQLRYRNLLACTAVILGLLAAAWVMAAPDTTAKPATVDTSKEKTALSQAFVVSRVFLKTVMTQISLMPLSRRLHCGLS